MHMTLKTPHRGVVHLAFETQEELCTAFVRLQEFYESPYPDIRNHYFTLDQFKARYAGDHGGVYTYNTDWHGFNVPGDVCRKFFDTFRGDLSVEEQEMMALPLPDGVGDYYVIGTHRDEDVDHEIAHALFYLDPDYHFNVTMDVAEFCKSFPRLSGTFGRWLYDRGYSANVLIDETNAYLATSDEAYWREHFDSAVADTLWWASAIMRDRFRARIQEV